MKYILTEKELNAHRQEIDKFKESLLIKQVKIECFNDALFDILSATLRVAVLTKAENLFNERMQKINEWKK